ncbi:MAG TPA: Y-family DNA polymerase [Blastocatellia bacterium]|nr:Y-family DNA polymerase [Blastocatellia bacterium]
MSDIFALVDCNNFYVSCERVFDHTLRNRPVVVLSNLDGCIVSRSNEAKALGIKMAIPVFQARDIIERNNVILKSSNYALYGDMSRRVMMTLREMCPEMEIYSIDEAFLTLNGHTEPLCKFGRAIKEKIYQHTGIPVSVGIAPTKTLAKTANYIAKKSEKARGVLDLTNPRHIEAALARTPVEEVWGIGRQHGKRLRNANVVTALDFRNLPDFWIGQQMGINGLRLAKELRGIACQGLDPRATPQKSALCSRSFGKQIETLSDMKQAIATFTARAAEKIRQRNLQARTVTVFMRTNQHRPDQPQYEHAETERLLYASSSTQELLHAALGLAERVFKEGFRYKKAGVILNWLQPSAPTEIRIFGEQETERQRRVMKLVDRINERYGRDSLRFAITGTDNKEQEWKHKFEHRSPCFTTQWDQLLTVT